MSGNPCDIVQSSAAVSDSQSFGLQTFLVVTAFVIGMAIEGVSGGVTDTAHAFEQVIQTGSTSVHDVALATSSVLQVVHGGTLVIDSANASDTLAATASKTSTDTAMVWAHVFDNVASTLGSTGHAVEAVTSRTTAGVTVLDTASAADGFSNKAVSTATSTAIASELLTSFRSITQTVTAFAVASDHLIDAGSTASEVHDSFVVTSQVTAFSHGVTLVTDWANAEEAVNAGSGGTIWTAMTESFGMSQFDGGDINSLAVVDGVLCVTDGTGLHALDASIAGEAVVATGLMDMGEKLQRATHCYAGYQSGAALKLLVGNTESGNETTYTYLLEPRTANVAVPGKAKLGRGIKSRYWRFTVRNQPGQSFQLHDLLLQNDETSRRV
ncbi:MAG: hypothetical protein K2Y25_09355 [Pseudomonadaceae bacterium]|nr:hypothetical protein [Pseudomonadaceae bacterium]